MAKNPQRDKELLKHILCHIERIKSKRENIKDLEDFDRLQMQLERNL